MMMSAHIPTLFLLPVTQQILTTKPDNINAYLNTLPNLSVIEAFQYLAEQHPGKVIFSTSFGIEDNREDKSSHPDSFSTAAAIGLRLDSVSIFFETSSTDLGNLLKAQ